MKYICWDIDGTLLLTNYAGVAAMKSTINDLYGLDNFEFTYGMAGRTDTYIARKAIEGIQGHCTPDEVTRMLQAYGKNSRPPWWPKKAISCPMYRPPWTGSGKTRTPPACCLPATAK